MTDKIKETTRQIDNTKDTVLKLSELRKLKIEITKLENDFIKNISQTNVRKRKDVCQRWLIYLWRTMWNQQSQLRRYSLLYQYNWFLNIFLTFVKKI